MGKNKKKKEKIIYVDDGSTVADMSGVDGKKKASNSRQKKANSSYRGGFRDQFKTFTDAQRAMLMPMLVTLAIIAIAFLLVYLIL